MNRQKQKEGLQTKKKILQILLVGIALGGFWFEAGKQERALREIFQAGTP